MQIIEKDPKLDSYLSNYTEFNDWLIQQRYRYLRRFFTGNSCLELGSAEGSGTQFLINHFDELTIVDGSKDAVEKVRNDLSSPKLTAIHSYFEDMDLGDKKFDTIVLAHILEHVNDPQEVLKQAKKYLSSNGVMIIDVPNGNSLHRQIGVEMGLLTEKTQLNEADHSIGHQRVYLPQVFKDEIERANLVTREFGGMFLKVLSNSQTEKVFNEEQLEALFKVGCKNPDISAEMYIIATLP